MNDDQAQSRLFLASDQIWPSAINQHYPGAKFVARCRIASADVAVSDTFASVASENVWGVVIETSSGRFEGRTVSVVDDFGRELDATLQSDPLLAGDPESLFMASRYWELHPDFIQQLREVLRVRGLETNDEEPRDDGALNASAPVSG